MSDAREILKYWLKLGRDVHDRMTELDNNVKFTGELHYIFYLECTRIFDLIFDPKIFGFLFELAPLEKLQNLPI